MQPDISVIIPTFRRPHELGEAIESILGQNGITTEIIVVDDSPEGSAEPVVARLSRTNLIYRRMTPPTGGRPAAVRNVGWRVARAEILHFLDDDDRVPDGHYAAALAAFRAEPETGIVFGRVQPFGAPGTDLAAEAAYFAQAASRARRCASLGPKLGYAASMLFRPTLLVCGAALIRASCVKALGGFDEQLPIVEDVAFYARAMRRYRSRYLDRVALHYRIGPSLMHGPDRQEPINASYRAMQARHRAEWGLLDHYGLKLLSQVIAR